MTRPLLSKWYALPFALLVLLTASHAFAKPKVAVLGLEVTGAIDQTSTTVAHDLTEGLRSRAKAGNGPYLLAPNSDRELIDEKLIKMCDNEAPACMSEIGKDIGADILIYGKVEKEGAGYRATLHVLDVKKKAPTNEQTVNVPSGANGDAVRNIGKKAYGDLVGGPVSVAGATLIVKSNAQTGTVYVGDEEKAQLSDGMATLSLPEGRHTVAIESQGYERKETSVLLNANDTVTEMFTLSARGGGGGKGKGFNVWIPVFGVTAAAALGFAGFSVYSMSQADTEGGFVMGTNAQGQVISDADCGETGNTFVSGAEHFDEACRHDKNNWTYGFVAGGVGVVAVIAGYMAFVRGGKESSSETASKRTPKRSIAITPVFTPDGAGATMLMNW